MTFPFSALHCKVGTSWPVHHMAFAVFHHPYFNALRLTFLTFSSKGLFILSSRPFSVFHRHSLGREIPINHFSSFVPVSHLLGLVDEYITRISFLRLSLKLSSFENSGLWSQIGHFLNLWKTKRLEPLPSLGPLGCPPNCEKV